MEVNKPKEFALYRGDKFITIGTVRQIAKEQGLDPGHLYRLAGGYRKVKREESALIMVEIQDEEDDE